MDRYDAILEQLEQAQNRGLDSVNTRLDTIVESLEELIQSAKAAVQDARLEDAEELLPLAEVEALLAEARAEAEVPPPPPPGVRLENLQNLDAARSQSELLRALLPMLAEHVGRAVVLVIRDGVVSAWSGIGFADGEKLRSWHGGVTVSPSFSELIENSRPTRVDPKTDPLLSEWLQDDAIPDEGVLLPISLRGKLMGIVYVDHHGSQPWNVEAAQSLNAIACWLIDTLHHRTTIPTPTVAVITSAGISDVSESDTDAFEPPREEETHEPSDPAVAFVDSSEPPAVEQPDVSEEPEGPEFDFEPEEVSAEAEEQEEEFDPSATVQIDTAEGEVPSELAEEERPAEAAPPSAEVQPPVPEVEAPPPVRPVEPPPDIEAEPISDEDARQEEARRFARLLVSEIKLYNEDEVERGRTEKDLSTRLKEDIDRSREMFEKRIPADVREGHDYFQDELIRILADGDADALGM